MESATYKFNEKTDSIINPITYTRIPQRIISECQDTKKHRLKQYYSMSRCLIIGERETDELGWGDSGKLHIREYLDLDENATRRIHKPSEKCRGYRLGIFDACVRWFLVVLDQLGFLGYKRGQLAVHTT